MKQRKVLIQVAYLFFKSGFIILYSALFERAGKEATINSLLKFANNYETGKAINDLVKKADL